MKSLLPNKHFQVFLVKALQAPTTTSSTQKAFRSDYEFNHLSINPKELIFYQKLAKGILLNWKRLINCCANHWNHEIYSRWKLNPHKKHFFCYCSLKPESRLGRTLYRANKNICWTICWGELFCSCSAIPTNRGALCGRACFHPHRFRAKLEIVNYPKQIFALMTSLFTISTRTALASIVPRFDHKRSLTRSKHVSSGEAAVRAHIHTCHVGRNNIEKLI